MMPSSKPCVCGHQHDAHEHYRRGTDCAICGAEVCPKYRASRSRAVVQPPAPTTPQRQQADAARSSR